MSDTPPTPDASAPALGSAIRATPGGASTPVCPPGAPCEGYHGQLEAEYLELNRLSMPDLLSRLAAAGREHLSALRAHAGHAKGVDNGRLIVATDAVWYRDFEPHLTESRMIVAAEAGTFLPFEGDQRTTVAQFMNAPRASRGAARAVTPAPVGAAGAGGVPFPDTQLRALDSAEQTAFKRQVYNAHVASAQRRGRTFNANLSADELGLVEVRFRMRKDAAAVCAQLLAKARSDLAAAQGGGDALAVAATAIGVGSGYRSATEELTIWEGLFPSYYEATSARRQAADGGEHGPAAVAILVSWYSGRKAAPGFGNHTNGIAVDFVTTQDGKQLSAETSQNKLWLVSWFHGWLVAHADADFHFQPLATEAWHWEYHP